jgi:hypothetical protein
MSSFRPFAWCTYDHKIINCLKKCRLTSDAQISKNNSDEQFFKASRNWKSCSALACSDLLIKIAFAVLKEHRRLKELYKAIKNKVTNPRAMNLFQID